MIPPGPRSPELLCVWETVENWQIRRLQQSRTCYGLDDWTMCTCMQCRRGLVRRLALKNLHVPEEEQKLDHNEQLKPLTIAQLNILRALRMEIWRKADGKLVSTVKAVKHPVRLPVRRKFAINTDFFLRLYKYGPYLTPRTIKAY